MWEIAKIKVVIAVPSLAILQSVQKTKCQSYLKWFGRLDEIIVLNVRKTKMWGCPKKQLLQLFYDDSDVDFQKLLLQGRGWCPAIF